MVYLWRAVDDEDPVLDVVVQRRRNTKAAFRLLRKLLKNQGIKPSKIVRDRLRSYGSALNLLGMKHLQDVGGRKNIRAECCTFRYVEENKNHRNLDHSGTLKNCSPFTVKSTIPSTTDDISFHDQPSENSELKARLNGVW